MSEKADFIAKSIRMPPALVGAYEDLALQSRRNFSEEVLIAMEYRLGKKVRIPHEGKINQLDSKWPKKPKGSKNV